MNYVDEPIHLNLLNLFRGFNYVVFRSRRPLHSIIAIPRPLSACRQLSPNPEVCMVLLPVNTNTVSNRKRVHGGRSCFIAVPSMTF
jgi:hypothetical protein